MTKRFFHYTIQAHFKEIIRSGYIKVASQYVNENVRHVAWVSANPVWENTATKLIINDEGELTHATKSECHAFHGLARIEVSSALDLYNWDDYKKLSGETTEGIQLLVKQGRRMGAIPKEWYFSFNPIAEDYWLRTEVWNGLKWIPCKSC